MKKNDKLANSDFDNIRDITLNYGIVLRGSIAALNEIASFLKSQNDVQVVFSTVSDDEIWINRKTAGNNIKHQVGGEDD